MNMRIPSLIGRVALGCVVLAGCGGDRGATAPAASTPPPAATGTMNLDTAAVQAIVAAKTSETAEPFPLDNGAVSVIPAGDQTSAPISVNAT